MEKEMGFDLPEEIITSILCWLPVRSLIRFSCVSKRWHFIIISDRQFAKSHLQLALQRRTLTHRLFLTGRPPRLHSWENVDSFDGSVMELTIPAAECVGHKIAPYGLGKGFTDEVIVLTSCNGLVLLGHWRYCECLSIWNPSTGFFRRVPSPRITIENREIDKILQYTVSAFGYVSSTDDYKIVLVVPRRRRRGVDAFIFSLRANCWRVIEAPHSSSEDTHCHVGALFNGALHWINHRLGLLEPATLHAFDLAEEEFREFSLPVCFPFEDYPFIRVLSGGCLYVCCTGDFVDNGGEIWGMTQYAVSESWVKLFEIRPADLPDMFPKNCYNWIVCFVTEDGKLVIRVFDSNELVKFESRKEEELVELICIGRYLLPDVPEFTDTQYGGDLYAETLISVPV